MGKLFTINKRRADFIGWLAGLFTVVLLVSTPPTLPPDEPELWIIIVTLTALIINFGLSFTEGEISAAHSVGIMAYLVLARPDDISAPLWAVTFGVLIGVTLREIPRYGLAEWRNFTRDVWGTASRTIGQLVLSLAIGGWFYEELNGELPIQQLNPGDVIPVLGFVFVQLAVYLTLTVVHMRSRQGQQLGRRILLNWQSLIGVLLVPLPVAIVASVVYYTTSSVAFAVLSFALFITVMGVYAISRSQFKFEQQVRDLQTLATITNAMRTNLTVNALLDALYLQVASLLGSDSLTIALYDPDSGYIRFPIHRRQGQPIQLSPIPYIDHTANDKVSKHIGRHILEQAYEFRIVPREVPETAWVGVPILTSQKSVGAMIALDLSGTRQFSAQEKQLLSTIAAQAGVALDNAQLYDQARGRVNQLRTLTRVSTELSATLNPDAALEMAVMFAREVVGADAAAVYSWVNDSQQVRMSRWIGLSYSFVQDPPRPLILNMNNIDSRQKPLVVSDIDDDKRTEDLRPRFEDEGKNAFAEVLLRNAGEILGVLVVYYDEPHYHTDEDIEVLLTFASQTSLAISNAQLYRSKDAALSRRVEQLTLLESLGQELFSSRIQLEEVYARVLERAAQGTDASAGLLALRIEDSRTTTIAATFGDIPFEWAEGDAAMGATFHTMHNADTTLIHDIEKTPRFPTIRPTTRSVLSVPILQDLNVAGAITLESDHPETFTNEDMIFIMQVGAQIRIANDNLKLIRSIEATRDRLQTILDSMTEAIILVDTTGIVQLANPRVSELLGLEPAAFNQQSLRHYASYTQPQLPEILGFETDVLFSYLDQLEVNSFPYDQSAATYELVEHTHQRALVRTDVAVKDQLGSVIGWLMVFKDITEERELEQAREDLYSMIIHDLRGPMTGIKASLSMIHKYADGEMKPLLQNTSETASRAVNKLLNLINSLLDISKMENGTMTLDREPTHLAEIAEAVLDSFGPLAHEMEIHLDNHLPNNLPPLYADADKVERIITNLVDNAIKFTPSDGHVGIAAQLTTFTPANDDMAQAAPQSFAQIRVTDTGPGIPDDYKQRLFDRYVQVEGREGRRKGTGLGLTFCMLAVRAHGGDIWVEDNPGGGSVFNFTVPLLTENMFAETGNDAQNNAAS